MSSCCLFIEVESPSCVPVGIIIGILFYLFGSPTCNLPKTWVPFRRSVLWLPACKSVPICSVADIWPLMTGPPALPESENPFPAFSFSICHSPFGIIGTWCLCPSPIKTTAYGLSQRLQKPQHLFTWLCVPGICITLVHG